MAFYLGSTFYSDSHIRLLGPLASIPPSNYYNYSTSCDRVFVEVSAEVIKSVTGSSVTEC